MQTMILPKTELKSLAITLATNNINVISQDLDPEIVGSVLMQSSYSISISKIILDDL